MPRLRPLTESECYARLYGDRDSTVAVIREPEAERPDGRLLGDRPRRTLDESPGVGGPDDVPEVEAA